MSCSVSERGSGAAASGVPAAGAGRRRGRAAAASGGGGGGGGARNGPRPAAPGAAVAAVAAAAAAAATDAAPPADAAAAAAQPHRPPRPCCSILWCCCCCCKCPCSNPNNKTNDESDRTKNSNLEAEDRELPPPSAEEVRSWGKSFDRLMKSTVGRKIFREFLKGEYSEENILFWQACEDLKKQTNKEVIEERARLVYEDYISILSPKEVSLDAAVREIVNRNMVEPTAHTFDEAQLQIYTLMHRDSYPRFVNSQIYKNLLCRYDEKDGNEKADEIKEIPPQVASTAAAAGKPSSSSSASTPKAPPAPSSDAAISTTASPDRGQRDQKNVG